MEPGFTHVFLPAQSIATEEDVRLVLEKFGIDKSQLPRMLTDDPVAKALNAASGDVIKCMRVSGITQKEEPYYRLVRD
ncbi:MAG: DNA-directed RNA polymerase subunit RpoH/Rpb5 C-terminal domain-containing protein [Candidatus Micrarchaeota archaeon]